MPLKWLMLFEDFNSALLRWRIKLEYLDHEWYIGKHNKIKTKHFSFSRVGIHKKEIRQLKILAQYRWIKQIFWNPFISMKCFFLMTSQKPTYSLQTL